MFNYYKMILYLFYIFCILTNVYCYNESSHSNESDNDVPVELLDHTILDICMSGFKYYTEISIGTQKKTIKVLPDTLMSFIMAPSCETVPDNCYETLKFNSTGKAYGYDIILDDIKGNLMNDTTVLVGNLTVPKQSFVLAEGPGIDKFGYLGLAYCETGMQGEKSLIENVSLLHTMVKGMKSPLFCLYYNREIRVPGKVGELLLGDSDSNQYEGDLTYVSTTSKESWKIEMNDVSMNGTTLCSKSCPALIASAYFFIAAPGSAIKKINEIIDANLEKGTVECNKVSDLPDFIIQLGSKKFILKGEHYTFEIGKVCYSGFANSSVENWALGTVFLSRFYSQFDLDKRSIGFAERHFTSQ